MNINFTYWADPVPTGFVRVQAAKASDPGTIVATQIFGPPHLNPRDVSLYVPSPVVHVVSIYEAPDEVSKGVLKSLYVATPSFDGPIVIPPLMIKVGRGIPDRDPVDNSTEVAIPSIAGYTISWVEQRGSGPLVGPNDTNDPLAVEWQPRPGGGIDLQNGKMFYDKEEYWIYFEPTLDGNVSAAIQDLTDLLEAHINDHNNPHQVTKAQVGLGNLPNATSNSYQLNDPNTLATSKAVHDLWQSIDSAIIYRDQILVGEIPARRDKLLTITHNQNLAVDSYMVIGTLLGYMPDWNQDNDVTFITRAPLGANSFQIAVRNLGDYTAGLVFHFIMVRA